jgi:Na/Pi-cotransporter
MSAFQTVIGALAAVVLFLYALRGFSREVQAAGGPALRAWIGRVTASRWRGFAIGMLATAIVQSSSAVTALAVSLVEAGVLTFRASLGVLLGANVGTTATAWLVSFKLTGIGPAFIVLGAAVSALPVRLRILGQALFYFGLVFFALDVVSLALAPLRDEPVFMGWLAGAGSPLAGALGGLVLTALVQSSSVTTGLAILFVQQGLLPADAAIFVVIGANVGTTSTSLLAGFGAGPTARATALANLVFNVAGLVVYLPFLGAFAHAVTSRSDDPSLAVAWAHVVFNVSVALPMLLLLGRLARLLERVLGAPREART